MHSLREKQYVTGNTPAQICLENNIYTGNLHNAQKTVEQFIKLSICLFLSSFV